MSLLFVTAFPTGAWSGARTCWKSVEYVEGMNPRTLSVHLTIEEGSTKDVICQKVVKWATTQTKVAAVYVLGNTEAIPRLRTILSGNSMHFPLHGIKWTEKSHVACQHGRCQYQPSNSCTVCDINMSHRVRSIVCPECFVDMSSPVQ